MAAAPDRIRRVPNDVERQGQAGNRLDRITEFRMHLDLASVTIRDECAKNRRMERELR